MSFGALSQDQLLRSLQSDYDATTPDAHIIARQVVYQLQKKGAKTTKVPVPRATDLAFSITGIANDHTTGAAGAPTLTLTMQDPEWKLMDSGFFDADAKGRLQDLDLNYPEGSRFWWRLHQVSPQQDKSLQLVFVPRIVAELMGVFGPVKVDRATRTRAQFLKMLCGKIKDAQGPVEFYSRELTVKQPIANSGATAATKSSAKVSTPGAAAKVVGIGANSGSLKCKGSTLTSAQAQAVNVIIQVGDQLSAPKNAIIAALYAAMGESNIDPHAPGGGCFQTSCNAAAYSGGTDLSGQAKGWFTGGECFGNGGGIKLANQGVAPWQIANMVENNYAWIYQQHDSYGHQWPGGQAQGIAEATAMADGGGVTDAAALTGTGSTGTIQVAQAYYFQINAGEDYWSGMCRLAQEVAWELIVDGNRVYFDADTVLIKQKIAAVIGRDDNTTLLWSYDWENRHIATNFQLQIVCDPFEFCSGEVLQVKGFGAASSGSTAGLPGRWLINQVSRGAGDLYSTFTLVQPTPPKPEPAPQYTTQTVGGVSGVAPPPGVGGTVNMPGTIQDYPPRSAERVYCAAQYLSSLKLIYSKSYRTMIQDIGIYAGTPAYDCSASTWWCILAGGFPLPGGVTWGGWAPTAQTDGLLPGPGQFLTIYASFPHDHVFFRCHPQGYADMQGNTVNAGLGHGFVFFPWNTPGTGSYGGPSPFADFPMWHYAGT